MKIAGATTVQSYLANLPPERREIVARMRDLVNANVPIGYEESLGYGMIAWAIPLSRFPTTYNGQPLCYAALAAQKNHYALYLMCVYGSSPLEAELRAGFAKDGKRLDMGKSCVRFKRIEDLSLPAIERVLRKVKPETLIERHEQAHSPAAVAKRRAERRAERRATTTPAGGRSAAKKRSG